MTATGTFLGWANFVDVCYVLLLDGTGLGFITRPELAEVRGAWSAATGGLWGDQIYGGLLLQGSIERRIEMFDAEFKASSMRFSILDYNDVLGPLIFGEARTDILRSTLAETMLPNGANLAVEDPTQIPGLGLVYVGLETMNRLAVGSSAGNWLVNRGYRSIFTRTGSPIWGRYHEVGADGDAPDVTTQPTVWLNRPVGLYACHRVGGTWAAGFPGSVANDAELLWAGTIKHYGESGDGWITLDCEEITGLTKTSVGARVFEAELDEGTRFLSEDEEIQFRARIRHYSDPTTLDQVYGGDTYVGSITLTGARRSHAYVASEINDALTSILTGTNDGVYAPTGMVGELSLETEPDGSQAYHLVFTWDDAPTTGILVGEVEMWLSPQVWLLLGFKQDSKDGRRNSAGDGWIERVSTPESDLAPLWRRIASDSPMRFTVRFDKYSSVGQQIDFANENVIPFTPQPVRPAGYPTETEGFIRLNEGPIIAVEREGSNAFNVLALVSTDYKSGRADAGNILSGNNELSPFLWAYDDGGAALKIRQVWIQPFDTIGEAMLTLLSSTGATDYNLTGYDALPHGFGLAFPSSLLDVASFEGMPAVPYQLVIEKSTPAATLLEAMLNTVGYHPVWRSSRIAAIDPLADPSPGILSLTEHNRVALAGQGSGGEFMASPIERNPETIINQFSLRHSPQPGGSWRYVEVVEAVKSKSEHHQARNLVIDGYGIFQDGATYWRDNVAPAAILYFSEPVALGQRTANFNLGSQLYPAAQAIVADPWIRDPRTGRRGVTDLVVWILSVTLDWVTGIADLEYVFAPRALRDVP